MYFTHIQDDELLPISEQIDMAENTVSREKLARLHKSLNREFSRSAISALEYIDMSTQLNKQKAALENTH